MAVLFTVVLCMFASVAWTQRDAYEWVVQSEQEYLLPDLPYSYDGLEPFLDAATLRVHHLGHH